MRKRIVPLTLLETSSGSDQGWLNLSGIATVEVTSEQDGFAIESVFASDTSRGWRASRAGAQVVRIVFDEPVAVGRIRMRFDESQSQRTQQFTLNWHPATGGCREIVRQQWNFSPQGSTSEFEDYQVDLDGVSVLELALKPDLTPNNAFATLAAWRVS